MSVFAHSSALVKFYAEESDHELVRSIDVLIVSQVARVEVPAALWRKQRLGELGADQARLLSDDFEADFFGTDGDEPRFSSLAKSSIELPACATCTGSGPTMLCSWGAPWRSVRWRAPVGPSLSSTTGRGRRRLHLGAGGVSQEQHRAAARGGMLVA